ncbi:hypothetical protein BTUL_0097g00410 [Botrytis tulipae]|uniref:Uncharacterized protein n=1 Tax=Botrytis tulipae TaxID=87230 RepID=A0A4Z1ELB0_9HELO|nr:hypothetical protein BTUL_0097g00410 [Botrytis tulipae]
MGGPSESNSSVKKDGIPLITLIADINSLQGSNAKSISYQKFNWQIEKHNPACVDFTESIDFVPTPSLFNEQLAILPSEISTRVVLLVQRPEFTSLDTWNSSHNEAIIYSACSTTHEILETTYNVGYKSGLKLYDLNPTISQLGVFFGPYQYRSPRPRLRWVINDRGNCKTMVIYYWMWMDMIIVGQSKEDTARQHADTVVQSFVNHWNNFTNSDTQSIESSPIEFLIPLNPGLGRVLSPHN